MSIERILQSPELVEEIARRLEAAPANDPRRAVLSPEKVRAAGEAARQGQEARLSRLEEAIIRREGRPVLFVRDDRIDAMAGDFWRSRLEAARARIEALLPAVGRVDLARHPLRKWAGTAWLITPEVVVTNRHVALAFGYKEDGEFVLDIDPLGQKVETTVDFRHEHERAARRVFQVVRVLHVEDPGDGRPDVALLQVARRDESDGPLPERILLAEADAAPGAVVGAIGYPAWDGDRNDAAVMSTLFGDVYDVKRFLPGEVMDSQAAYLSHDCSTLGGNSGSVVVDFATGRAVGLHYAGYYEDRNFAVKASTLRELLQRVKIDP
jgi:endonuclease G